MDNFEQVVQAGPQVAELLAVCPRLKVLATSREVLHLSCERVFSVPPLRLPAAEQLPEGIQTLSEYGAVAFFVQRARIAKPDPQRDRLPMLGAHSCEQKRGFRRWPAQTTAQPLLEFTFDEGSGSNAANTGTTGAALNGTIGNQVIYSTDTPLGSGSSLEFDGSGDWSSNDDMVYVPQAYTASGHPLRYYHGDKLTVEAWIKPDATNGQRIVWETMETPAFCWTYGTAKWISACPQPPTLVAARG